MPWCETCARFWNPPSMGRTGTCPTCGTSIATADRDADTRAPWHFKLLVVAVIGYLAWRAVELVGWIL